MADPDTRDPRLDLADEIMVQHLDRLEQIITERDTELRRLRTELELRNLYTAELHSSLKHQAAQLQELEARLSRCEAAFPCTS
ncbi:MAG: hypothetical protein HY821_24520 [Acidobacteria bacterium]|nr:hypothetical protein [Acidobacteriota bacterium]